MTEYQDLPSTQKQARKEGEKFYFTGVPCKYGHLSRRYAGGRNCVACDLHRAASDRAGARLRARNWHIARKIQDPLAYYIHRKGIACKSAGVPYDLDLDYVKSIIPVDGLCPILKTKLLMPGEGGDGCRSEQMTLDQIRPQDGYLRGNVAILSHRANRLKNNVTDPDVFRRLADWLDNQTTKSRSTRSQ
jgi:hypothetical protein